jgi:small subunit ribosomal protein S17
MTKTTTTKAKILKGTVVSTKMKDTIVVLVDRFEKHPKYEKFIKRSKKFKAHDAGNTAQMGDKVQIMETKPISKDKHFKLIGNSKLKIEN